MPKIQRLDKIAINVKAHVLLKSLMEENPKLEEILQNKANETKALAGIRMWMIGVLKENQDAYKYYINRAKGRQAYEKVNWRNYATIRMLDYIDNAGKEYDDYNLKGQKAFSNPFKLLWLAYNYGTGGAKPDFFQDMIYLFRQFNGTYLQLKPGKERLDVWTERHISGLDPRIIKLRKENRDRIINVFIKKIDKGDIKDSKYFFTKGISKNEKIKLMQEWWNEHVFHLRFAVRTPKLLNELLDNSLDPDTLVILYKAEKKGIPFFVNPYYLSLLLVRSPYYAIGADLAIRNYIIYSSQLVEKFGTIQAWEKEDIVEPGKPNAAGWVLPTHHNVHRRYPEVAILIPSTMGRTCGGLCASCQRMYDFQRGNLNFNLSKLKPKSTWKKDLKTIIKYWENDAQLRDVLITGGDAFMSTDSSLKAVLDEVYEMAKRKREGNKIRKNKKKYAEILRVRLGTRIPVYIPQRVTKELINILFEFRKKSLLIGVKQFIIQTHFESAIEITSESKACIQKLIAAGWQVVNQHVLTTSSSRRGHNNKLRQILNDIGVLPYYTFTVKGYKENYSNFATNARAVQEQAEEKIIGIPNDKMIKEISKLALEPDKVVANVNKIRSKAKLPFLATDRNVLNLPGVGKSLSYRVIGITRYGRRILEFDHDNTRNHSPIIHKMGKVIIIESKSISEYLRQLEDLGEDINNYESIWGYSISETEMRLPIYEYPEYDFEITDELTNFGL